MKEIRKSKGFTQEELATASGVARVTIARIETGKAEAKFVTVVRLAKALNVTVDELIDTKAG